MNYTIIIPIHNEEKSIPTLLKNLRFLAKQNEILVINDGSTDNSKKILQKSPFINLQSLDKNYGKGYAIRYGLSISKFDKILITDGDLELKISELSRLMILEKDQNINCTLGSRYDKIDYLDSFWSLGNYLFKRLFNILHNTEINDVLCCAKSFYKSDLKIDLIKSSGFDIDIELTSLLVKKFNPVPEIKLTYKRRTISDGKKIRLRDGLIILFRVFNS